VAASRELVDRDALERKCETFHDSCFATRLVLPTSKECALTTTHSLLRYYAHRSTGGYYILEGTVKSVQCVYVHERRQKNAIKVYNAASPA
jgi:diphthamide biosynthesis methyltransferase